MNVVGGPTMSSSKYISHAIHKSHVENTCKGGISQARCHSETRASRVQSNSKERPRRAEGQPPWISKASSPYGTTIGSAEESGGGVRACSTYQRISCLPVCSTNMATVSGSLECLAERHRHPAQGEWGMDGICCIKCSRKRQKKTYIYIYIYI